MGGKPKSVEAYEAEATWCGTCLVHPAYRGISRKLWKLRHRKNLSSKLMVCHTCDNPHCILDAHHFLGTAKDNQHDAVLKGRHTGFRKRSDAERSKISSSLKKNWEDPKFRRMMCKAAKESWKDEAVKCARVAVLIEATAVPTGVRSARAKAQWEGEFGEKMRSEEGRAYMSKIQKQLARRRKK